MIPRGLELSGGRFEWGAVVDCSKKYYCVSMMHDYGGQRARHIPLYRVLNHALLLLTWTEK